MPTIQKRHNRSGTISFIAWVRIKPFKPTSKAFSTRDAAKDWAEDQARQLREHHRRGEPAGDLIQLTLSELIQEYLGDPETQKLSSFDGYDRLLSCPRCLLKRSPLVGQAAQKFTNTDVDV